MTNDQAPMTIPRGQSLAWNGHWGSVIAAFPSFRVTFLDARATPLLPRGNPPTA